MDKLLVQKCHLPEVLDVSMTTIKVMINDGLLPPPAGRISSRLAWSIADLNLWIKLGMPSETEFVERKKVLTDTEKAC